MSARQGRKACTVAASVVLAKRWKLLLENVAAQKRKKDAQQLGTQWWIKNYQSTRRRKCITTNIGQDNSGGYTLRAARQHYCLAGNNSRVCG